MHKSTVSHLRNSDVFVEQEHCLVSNETNALLLNKSNVLALNKDNALFWNKGFVSIGSFFSKLYIGMCFKVSGFAKGPKMPP